MLLIVTNQQDITCDLVVLALQRRGVPYARFNTEDVPTGAALTWTLASSREDACLALPTGSVALGEIDAVWYRRPTSPAPDVDDPGARAFAASEAQAALDNLWAVLPGLWVSRPAAIRAAGHKLHQLRSAAASGFEVPPTLLTSDPARARAFCAAHRAVVAKPLGRGYVDTAEGSRALVFANLLGPADLARLDEVAAAPTLFQTFVEKAADLRVTVVGRRVFATAIRARSGPPPVDWRRRDLDDLAHDLVELPATLEDRVRGYVAGYGLQFGALDFVLTPDGRYVFLEINPNGQWGWIEQVTGAPIADALVDLFVGRALPL